jgi:hypothetical protein
LYIKRGKGFMLLCGAQTLNMSVMDQTTDDFNLHK